MLQQQGGCPVYKLKPRISFGNDQLLDAGSYRIQIPPQLAASNAHAPVFVDAGKINSLRQTAGGGHGPGLGVTHGLTVTDIDIGFSNLSQQWRQVRTSAAMPSWQFVGGDVFLDATITVYVYDGDRPDLSDKLKTDIFAIIMQHELLHVLDEIDIVSRWMVPQVYSDEKVTRYLTNAELVDYSMFRSWFQGDLFSNWLKDGIWAPEHNRRGSLRDGAHQYAKLQSEIQDLQVQMINRH